MSLITVGLRSVAKLRYLIGGENVVDVQAVEMKIGLFTVKRSASPF